MPCYDPETHERPKRLEEKVHKLTALLCYICREVETEGEHGILSDHPELSKWWTDHKTHDARVAAIKEKSDRLGDASLTPEERGLLYTANDISYSADTRPSAIIIL